MNRMEQLLNKIERRLGTKLLNLPKEISKDVWADEVIDQDTLTTFSRFFPNDIVYVLEPTTPQKDGWYLIDEEKINSAEIIGVGDIDFRILSKEMNFGSIQYGFLDTIATSFGIDDVFRFQALSDLTSIFQNNLYLMFKAPNMVRINDSVNIDNIKSLRRVPIHLWTKHPKNLMTISQTQFETFENLAVCDVAAFLYENLKYMDGLENVYANIDLKIQDLQQKAERRDEIVQKLDDAHVSFANNTHMPMILTV